MSSNNASNITTPVVTLTATEIWIQLIVFYGLLCGIISTVCSILIWVGIWRKKQLRSRFFIIVACLMFCRTGSCFQVLCGTIFRSLRTLGVVETNQLRITCHFVHFWIIYGLTLELTLLCTLVIDRMLAVIKTNYYRLLTDKSAFYTCAAQYLIVGAIKFVPSYLGDNMLGIAPCVNIYSFLNATFNLFNQTVDVVLVVLILLLYFVLIFYVSRGVKLLASKSENDVASTSLKRQLKLMPILRNLVLMHCGLSLTSKAIMFAAGLVPTDYNQTVTALGGVFTSLDLFINVVYLLITNEDVKDAAFPCRKKNAVTSIKTNNEIKALPVIAGSAAASLPLTKGVVSSH